MLSPIKIEAFQNGNIEFVVREKPVSSQNKNSNKLHLKKIIRKITSSCAYIVTGCCWVHIEYYSSNYNRYKNPGVYDLDNIIKPILDSLIGLQGIILDDSLFERVSVNWIDTPHEDHFEVTLKYPDLLFTQKDDLILVKSSNGWCFPASKKFLTPCREVIFRAFAIWEKVTNEDLYYEYLPIMPIQNFLFYSKVKDKDYNFIDLSEI